MMKQIKPIIYSKFIRNKQLDYIFYNMYTKKYQSFQWKSKEEILDIQVKKLKRILKIAIETVPFYRNLKIDINFQKFTLDELKKFPVVDKKIISENFKDFCSTRYDGILSHTSGSTGTPFEFKIPVQSDIIENLTKFRAWGMGKDYVYKKGDPIIVLRSYSPNENDPLIKVSKSENYWYLSPFHINQKNLNLYLDVIKRSNAQLMRGYPSSIYIFTLLLKENDIRLPQIKTLVTSSETLLPMYREIIENYWQIPVLDWYGQNERTVTVQQCWAGNYHNNDDYGIVELDMDNYIIATSLNNYVMPFIRYNTGDKAIPLDKPIEKCECGRHLSIPFKGIEGRSDDILIKDDGTMIPSINIYTLMHELGFIKHFQIIQQKNGAIIIKVVGNINKQNSIILVDEMKKRLGNIEFTIMAVENIERDRKTGKIKTIIREK